MNNVLRKLKENSALIVNVAFIVAASCMLITGISNLDGNVFGVLGGIIATFLMVLMLAALPLLKVLKKDDLAKPVTLIVIGYFFVYTTLNYLSASYMIDGDHKAYTVIVSIFIFLAALALIAAFATYLVSIFTKNDELKKIVAFILAGLCAYLVVVFILQFIRLIVFNYGWPSYFDAIADYIAIPAALIFSVFPLLIGKISDANDDGEKEETEE